MLANKGAKRVLKRMTNINRRPPFEFNLLKELYEKNNE